MKLVTMGSLGKDDVKDLRGQACLVLVGTPDEVRGAAPLLYQEVSLSVAGVKQASTMTDEQLVVACANVGVDLGCGACAILFYTGTGMIHDEHTCKGPHPDPRRIITPGGAVVELAGQCMGPETKGEK